METVEGVHRRSLPLFHPERLKSRTGAILVAFGRPGLSLGSIPSNDKCQAHIPWISASVHLPTCGFDAKLEAGISEGGRVQGQAAIQASLINCDHLLNNLCARELL